MNSKTSTKSLIKEANTISPLDRFIRPVLYTFLLLFLLTGSLLVIYTVVKNSKLKEMDNTQIQELDHMENQIHDTMQNIDLSLYSIAGSDSALRALQKKDPMAMRDISSLMLTINNYRHSYDQLRILDQSGNEVIRVNLSPNGKSYLVPSSELQNKANRYYFKEAIKLEGDKIYLSAFDLNVEKGQVETPLKPMIRMARSIRDAQGKTQGIAILNYLGVELLEIIDRHNEHHGDQWYLINDKGYYLKGPRKDLDFAFMFPQKSDIGLFSEMPQLWATIQSNKQNKWSSPNGVYYFKTISPLPPSIQADLAEKWTIIMHVPETVKKGSLSLLDHAIRLTSYIAYPLFIVLGIFLGITRSRNQWLISELKRQADLDELTGLLNRRAVLTRLEYLISLIRRNRSPLSVVYADINNLKLINDLQGHEAGDAMLLAAARSFTKEVRASDFAARIGGDEFLIVFPGCEPDKAQLIMERVMYHFEAEGRRFNGQSWKISWGSAYWLGDSDSLDHLINRADEKMYQMKKKLKGEKEEDAPPIDHIPLPD